MKIFNQIRSERLSYISQHSIFWYTIHSIFSVTAITSIYESFETISFRFIYIFFASFLRFRHLFILRYRINSRIFTRISTRNLFITQSKWRFLFLRSSSHSIFFLDHFFFASVSTRMIRKRKILDRCITSTRTQILLVFRDAVDSLKRKEHKRIIIYENMSWKSKTNSKRKWNSWQNKKRKLVWSKNELKNIRANVANIRSNSIITSNFTNIFVLVTSKSRNQLFRRLRKFQNRNSLRNSQCFHLFRHFNR